MKNLLAVLGVSFLLAGCFDDKRMQNADSSQMPVEQKQPQTGVKSEEKSSEQRIRDDKTSSEKSDKSDKAADADKKKEDTAELVKANKVTESHKFIEKRHKSEKSITRKSFVAISHEKKAENKTKRSVVKSKSANKRRQAVNGTYENGKLVSNFSPEELRVGAQVPMSDNEIRQQKMQCRYPFMSQQEVAENNCSVKNVMISY